MWLCRGFQIEGQKREKEEEKKIEEGVSKRVKKERFKKEEYKRKREREKERCTFESLSLILRKHYDWEGAVGLGVSDLFVCVVLVKSWKISKEIDLGVW